MYKTKEMWPRCSNSLDENVESNAAYEHVIDDLLSRMSVREKVGQMIQAEIARITPEEAAEYHIGSILNGGGSFPYSDKRATVSAWIDLADRFYQHSVRADGTGIPILWGTDAVHGHNNVFGATIFPHNIGLGATNDPDIAERIGAATASDVAATGMDWNFSPTLAVPLDRFWGRTYEGFSEDPAIVSRLAAAMVKGTQGKLDSPEFLGESKVLATAKHFIGEGGTTNGIDQGDTVCTEQELREIHGMPHIACLRAGVQTVMVTYSSWNGDKLHGHAYLLTEVLKNKMGFHGFVVSDWNGYEQIDEDRVVACHRSVNAGIDMLMVAEDWREIWNILFEEVLRGDIAMSRIDDAVRRILRVKMLFGLFDGVSPRERTKRFSNALPQPAINQSLAREAVKKSLVLLKNNHSVLPLNRDIKVLVAGTHADSIPDQCGGWSLTWQGTDSSNDDFPEAESILTGVRRVVGSQGVVEHFADGNFSTLPDVAIVVFGESPYAEGEGDLVHLSFSAQHSEPLQIMRRLKRLDIPVVGVLMSGRPMWTNPEINATDAFVSAWLPGTQGGAIADVLFRDEVGAIACDFLGRLPFSWPASPLQSSSTIDDQGRSPLFAVGYGLSYSDQNKCVCLVTLDELDETTSSPAARNPYRPSTQPYFRQ